MPDEKEAETPIDAAFPPLKQQLLGIALGQVLSILITGTGVFSQLLAINYDVKVPTAQSFLNYLFLSLYSFKLLYSLGFHQFWLILKKHSYYYLPLSLIDVEANYLGNFQ
jgi:solute carrier family 35 protein F1/2